MREKKKKKKFSTRVFRRSQTHYDLTLDRVDRKYGKSGRRPAKGFLFLSFFFFLF